MVELNHLRPIDLISFLLFIKVWSIWKIFVQENHFPLDKKFVRKRLKNVYWNLEDFRIGLGLTPISCRIIWVRKRASMLLYDDLSVNGIETNACCNTVHQAISFARSLWSKLCGSTHEKWNVNIALLEPIFKKNNVFLIRPAIKFYFFQLYLDLNMEKRWNINDINRHLSIRNARPLSSKAERRFHNLLEQNI